VQKGGPSSYYDHDESRYETTRYTQGSVLHLQSKGLPVRCPADAARKIKQIGYECLRIYFLSRRDQLGKTSRPITHYCDILDIHDGDSQLRALCFTASARFELAFRNSMSEVLSAQYGSHPYYDSNAFKGSAKQDEALRQVIDISLKSRDERARHYRLTYFTPSLPPIWMFKEFLTFGSAARFYTRLANPIRQQIAACFSINELPVFDSWVGSFVDLRNICAHHDRLFNRRFQKQPKLLRSAQIPKASSNTLKAQLECLDFVLSSQGMTSSIVNRAAKIIGKHTAILPSEAGF